MKSKKTNERLRDYQDKYERSLSEYAELDKFKKRLAQFNGTKDIEGGKPVSVVWNFSSEIVESQTDNTIPRPKVTPKNPQDRTIRNAQAIEDMLRGEIDRMPFEQMNDEDERNAKVFGGSGFLVEWDSRFESGETIGGLSVRLLSAMQIIPQYGVLETRYMDYIFLTFDDTKSRIKMRYGKDVEQESTDPRTSEHAATDDTVTQVVCFYKNKSGKLGCVSWVNDTVLIDDDSYEARKDKVCARCGKTKLDNKCACGSEEWIDRPAEYEELYEDLVLSDGRLVPSLSPAADEEGNPAMEDYQTEEIDPATGYPVMDYVFDRGVIAGERPRMTTAQRPVYEPTRIPHYYPSSYPVVIRKNVSAYNKFLGDSDMDIIKDFQEGANKLLSKAQTKVLKAGSVLTKMQKTKFQFSDEDIKPLNVDDIAEVQAIRAINLTFDTSQDMATAESYYQKAKSLIGITDLYQGKADNTAQSGRAKEIMVQQAAGRQRSKRVMKNAAYADLYEMMFKFMLAYTDEPRVYSAVDDDGRQVQRVFNKYDFLEQDEFGNWYFNDEYYFSVDESGVDASNKQFMLEDVRQDFSMGAFGNPADPRTMLRYWKEKEVIGYPNAKRNVKEWERVVAEADEQARLQQQMMQQPSVDGFLSGIPPEVQEQAVREQNPAVLEQYAQQNMR